MSYKTIHESWEDFKFHDPTPEKELFKNKFEEKVVRAIFFSGIASGLVLINSHLKEEKDINKILILLLKQLEEVSNEGEIVLQFQGITH